MSSEHTTVFSRDPATWPAAPTIVLTGGNSGVGYGTALRMLQQLSKSRATDLQKASPSLANQSKDCISEYNTPNGVTLIIASRNAVKGHKACTNLLRAMGKKRPPGEIDSYRWKQARKIRVMSSSSSDRTQPSSSLLAKQSLSEAEYHRYWLEGLQVHFVPLDLSRVESVLAFCEELKKRYGSLTHLMLNAGCGPFYALDWFKLVRHMTTAFIDCLTRPNYLLERPGIMTDDGLGWTFQCNVFGHYLLARELLPLFYKSEHSEPRIVWTGSLEGDSSWYDPDDYQAVKTDHSYHSTKYSESLLAWGMNDLIQKYEEENPSKVRVRSLLAHPGITAASMFIEIVGRLADFGMLFIFYLARWLGSHHHVVSPQKAGIVFVYLALAPLSLLAHHLQQAEENSEELSAASVGSVQWAPMRFGARCTRLGREYVGIDLVGQHQLDPRDEHWVDEKMAVDLLEKCESLRSKFLRAGEGT